MQNVYYYRPIKRRRSIGRLMLLLLFSFLFLVSCVAGSNALWIRGLLGVDLKDYRKEAVVTNLSVDSALSDSLCRTVELLVVSNTSLTVSSKPADLVNAHRDEILNHLLKEGYSNYTGNADAVREVERAYPNMTVSILIPASDLETLATRHFGIQNLRHGDGELFTYLEKVGYYTFSLKTWEQSARVVPESLEETYHTYRLRFCLEKDGVLSESYLAIFVKRNDGSAYLRALERG